MSNYNLSPSIYQQAQQVAAQQYSQQQPQSQQMSQFFPQAQGTVYLINNSMEVANIPIVGGMSIALCFNEGLLFLKTLQNGQPAMAVYNITQYVEPKKENESNQLEERVKALEEALKTKKGGASF